MIEIQHGCTQNVIGSNQYVYTEIKIKAHNEDYQSIMEVESNTTHYVFYVVDDQGPPKVGDFIDNGTLVRRTKPKVNNDWSRWKDKDL